MSGPVRVRFAPSPTGEPHVGNVRTAIFTWLFARGASGSFIIRVEDTDQARKVEGATEELLESLRWLGLDWDEGPDRGGEYGPYHQSQRLDLYSHACDELLGSGWAYRCYCPPERLASLRKEQARLKQPPGYDRRCRPLSGADRQTAEAAGVTPVIRFAMPADGSTAIHDMVRGHVSFENRLIDDFVIMKSDGFPTYHLANVVDDHLMEISHVMRAEEWLSSTPRHVQLYRALGWEPPPFAHLPIILAPDRSKLSKRHGATSVMEYRRGGYLPDAMVNFLTLLGWSLDDRTEIIPIHDLVRHFSIERITKAGAVFNAEKLLWMNGHYIRQAAVDALTEELLDYWRAFPPEGMPDLPSRERLRGIVPLIQERLKTLADAAPLVSFFFAEGVEYETEELVQKGMDSTSTSEVLKASLTRLEAVDGFEARSIEAELRPLADELDLKARQLFGALRVATTGLKVSPPLFETLELLGRERTVRSIADAISRLATALPNE